MKTIDEMIAVMTAYQEGKKIECIDDSPSSHWWHEVDKPNWDWAHCDFRIKPESKYVPYDSVDEIEKDKWLVSSDETRVTRVEILDRKSNTIYSRFGWLSLSELLDGYKYEDGTRCGKKVEECNNCKLIKAIDEVFKEREKHD